MLRAVLSGVTARRALGAGLLLLASLPGYRLLVTPDTGPAGAATVAAAASYAAVTWSGTLVILLVAGLAARLLPERRATRGAHWLEAALLRPHRHTFAGVCALFAAAFTWLVNEFVLHGQPFLVDALSQLVQARYVAAGHLAGPSSPFAPFWHLQQTILTPAGWVSQYPPAHVLLLALGFRLGAVQLVGPVLVGATVYVTGLLAHRLFADRPLVARVGLLLLAASPFVAVHAAGYMNHVTAACLSVLALWGATVLMDGGRWPGAAVLGSALAALLATRPLTAVVMGALVVGWWLARRQGWPRLRLVAAALLAALPLLLLLAWYNRHFFGSPFRFGYTAALGPDGGLGFGLDPWGNRYGLRAAAGYTAAELIALNQSLLESPLPVVSLVALALLLLPRLERGTRVVAAWALLPLFAHLGYWHHGLFMGPRMLNEYAPAWCLASAAAALALLRSAPAALSVAPRWSPRVFAGAALLLAWLLAVAWGTPARLLVYRAEHPAPAALNPPVPDSALVFVHGAWSVRLAMQLAGTGMRLDSLESLTRHNSTCTIQRWLDAGRRDVPVSFGRGAAPAGISEVEIAPGSRIRVEAAEWWPLACVRQAASDQAGVQEAASFLWHAGLPGLGPSPPLFVRDLGPDANRKLIAVLDRPAFVLRTAAGRIVLASYAEGISELWDSRGPPGRTIPPRSPGAESGS